MFPFPNSERFSKADGRTELSIFYSKHKISTQSTIFSQSFFLFSLLKIKFTIEQIFKLNAQHYWILIYVDFVRRVLGCCRLQGYTPAKK